jgi:tetratricopeptide (TPR) repeat protein
MTRLGGLADRARGAAGTALGQRAGRVGRLRVLAFATLVALATTTLSPARARADLLDDAWKRGNDAYLRGDYAAAVAAYEQLDRQQVISSELTFNLGNAYYRQGQLGRAIWCWERALAVDPDLEDARYNLDEARKVESTRVEDKIEGAEREATWIRLVSQLTASTETWLFVGLYLAFFVALGLRLRSRRRGGAADPRQGEEGHGSAWTALAAILGVGAALAAALVLGRVAMERVPSGVVLADQVAVKEGADPNYKTSFDVHAGLRVRLLEHDQDWVRIRLANGLEGWVRDRDVGPL